jgi:CubicO group peptidase (beta-lactamase class C family)
LKSSPSSWASHGNAAGLTQINDYIAAQIEEHGPGLALAIADGGAAVHTAAYGLANVRNGLPIEPDTMFHLASCGKQFTGLGILMLAGEGKLHLDDPADKHIPLLAGFGPGVTIRKLLHHTSGIRDLYDEDGVNRILTRCARPANADLIRTYSDLGCPMAEDGIEPGRRFSYSNSGYELLGAVIEEVSGEPYHDFFVKRVSDRLEMKDTFSVPGRPIEGSRFATGYWLAEGGELTEARASELDGLVGSGSFYTTVSDLCLYGEALRANSLVDEASLKEAFTSGQTNDGKSTNYGFGWFLSAQEGMSFADHEGSWNGFRSYICFCLDRPLSIFALSNHPKVDLLKVAHAATEAFR